MRKIQVTLSDHAELALAVVTMHYEIPAHVAIERLILGALDYISDQEIRKDPREGDRDTPHPVRGDSAASDVSTVTVAEAAA